VIGGATAPGGATEIQSQRIGGLKAEIAALIVSGQEGGEIDMVVAAQPAPGSTDEKNKIHLWIEARGGSILPEESLGRLEFYAYALTPTSGVAASLLETVSIETEVDAAPLRSHGLRFSGELAVPPGSYSLRVLIKEVASGRMGARTIAVDVPDYAELSPRLLAPLNPAPAEEWFAVRPVGEVAGGTSRTPQAVLPADSEVAVTSLLLGGTGVSTDSVEILASGTTLPAVVKSREPAARFGGEELTVQFDTAELAVGRHEIRVRIPDANLESPPLSVLVAPIEKPTSWVALNSSGDIAVAPSRAATSGKTKRQRRVRLDEKVEGDAYRAVLARLCDESIEDPEREADRMLREFERRVLRENTSDALPDLERLEADIAEDLAKSSPAVLAPIIQLHNRAYSYYFKRKEFLLSTFSRRTLVRLGSLYLRQVGDHAVQTHGADVFTSLGAELQTRDHGRLALEMFKRALEAEPEHRAAQIGLAMIYERAEAYEDAIYAFKQVLKADPNAWEARLRLAICELRIDRRTAGLRNLREIVKSESANAWIRTVAYHELGRWHLRREEYGQAIETLKGAVETLPYDSQIRVLLAYAHDAQRQPWTARETLGESVGDRETVTARIGDSPRRYYAVRENSHIAGVASRLDSWDRENRARLRKALSATARPEGAR